MNSVRMTNVRIGTVQIGIMVLTIATALIHFTRNFPDVMFMLNGLGYLTLLVALFLPNAQLARHRSKIRWALIAFTAVTILAWVAMGERILIGYVDKLIEVVLIGLLVIDGRERN
ncbi:MAG: hypothetical protein HZB51_09895 [Chloroflexi bacterium]|nr:hypothetical protein [Chloroflexota bacterium]